MLDFCKRIVDIESYATQPEGTNAVGDALCSELEKAGYSSERVRGAWLDIVPSTAHPIAMGGDELPSLGDAPRVHQVVGHTSNVPVRCATHAVESASS